MLSGSNRTLLSLGPSFDIHRREATPLSPASFASVAGEKVGIDTFRGGCYGGGGDILEDN